MEMTQTLNKKKNNSKLKILHHFIKIRTKVLVNMNNKVIKKIKKIYHQTKIENKKC